MNAIILAGGRGSRLEPWHAPKALLPINGLPVLFRIIGHLDSVGVMEVRHVNRVVVCTGYRGRDISNALFWKGNNTAVECSDADEDASMGARLIKARTITNSERVLILYGDELADVNIAALVKQHEAEGNKITFVATYQKIVGGMVFNKDKPVKIVEGQRVLVNIGFAVVEPECWELLKSEDGLSDWINRVSGHGLPVGVYHHEGKRATVNSLADLRFAEETWK